MKIIQINDHHRIIMTLENKLIDDVARKLEAFGIEIYRMPNANNDYLVTYKREGVCFPISCAINETFISVAKGAFKIK